MIALLFIAVVSANDYYYVDSAPLSPGDLVYVAKYGDCVGIYDVLCTLGTCNPSTPAFYMKTVKTNSDRPEPSYYSDSSCTIESTQNDYNNIVKVVEDSKHYLDQTYFNNNYNVKINYRCDDSKAATIYTKLGENFINNKYYAIQQINSMMMVVLLQ